MGLSRASSTPPDSMSTMSPALTAGPKESFSVAGTNAGRWSTRQLVTPSRLRATPRTLIPQRRCDRNSNAVSPPTIAAPALWTVTTCRPGSRHTEFTSADVSTGLAGKRSTGLVSDTAPWTPPRSIIRSTLASKLLGRLGANRRRLDNMSLCRTSPD